VSLNIKRVFTETKRDVVTTVNWIDRNAEIKNHKTGEVIFSQRGVVFPDFYSDTAVNVISQKYFWGELGTPERESSLWDLISRVVTTITKWGTACDYFQDAEEALAFSDELSYILLYQLACFNSPVWFNIGTPNKIQSAAACFLLDVEDDMDSIMGVAGTMATIFKGGSGTGLNLSPLRSEKEGLTGGGYASGPLSFLRIYDQTAGVVKSGGRSRRAAMWFGLSVSHPDIRSFIHCKAREEHKQRLLLAAVNAVKNGSMKVDKATQTFVEEVKDWESMDGENAKTAMFQNMNISVWITDEFMNAVEQNQSWDLKEVQTGRVVETLQARALYREICESAWASGDPGLCFYNTIEGWSTTKTSGPIKSTNPCTEVLSQPFTACNLSSLNLLKISELPTHTYTERQFVQHIVSIMATAQDILVDNSDYPTQRIDEETKKFRNIGVGFSNIGSLLMRKGIPYDSHTARTVAANFASLITASAYLQSTRIAAERSPFPAYEENKADMLEVIQQHIAHTNDDSLRELWKSVLFEGQKYGFANSQTSALAPTGTISLFMDCDTTGIEPEIALCKVKNLAGGGTIVQASGGVAEALASLGYTKQTVAEITAKIAEGIPPAKAGILPKDLSVFDTSLPVGGRSISAEAHVKMVAAVTPFITGSTSKTCNLPHKATVEDVAKIYKLAWISGVKAIAIFRKGCKLTEAITVKEDIHPAPVPTPVLPQKGNPEREKLPPTRAAIAHKFCIGGQEGLLHAGMYEDGRIGEIFLHMYGGGSTVGGLLATVGILLSWCAQHGILTNQLLGKLMRERFDPQGFTRDKMIKKAKSPVDFLARWIQKEFFSEEEEPKDKTIEITSITSQGPVITTGETCTACGDIMEPQGTCHFCPSCGTSSGGCS